MIFKKYGHQAWDNIVLNLRSSSYVTKDFYIDGGFLSKEFKSSEENFFIAELELIIMAMKLLKS